MFNKTSQIRHSWLLIVLFSGLALGSVAFFPMSGMSFALPKLFVFAVTATIGTCWFALSSDIQAMRIFTRTVTGRFLLGFFVIVLLSLAWSVSPMLSFLGTPPRLEGILTHVIWFAFVLIGIGIAQSKQGEKGLLQTIIVSNLLLILYGFFQFLSLDPFRGIWAEGTFLGRTFSLAGQPNVLGAFIVLTFPIILFSALSKKEGKEERHFLILLCALNLIVLITTVSRSSLLGLGGAILFLLAFAPGVLHACKKVKGWTMLLLGLVLFVLLFTIFIAFSQRFSLETQDRSMRARSIIWSDTISIILDHPQGIGLETMGIVYPQYKSARLLEVESLQTNIDRAHSKPLDILVSLGPLGLLAYYGFLISLLIFSAKQKKSYEYISALGAGIFGYSVALLFGFEHVLTSAFFWIIVGWILGVSWRSKKRKAATYVLTMRSIVILLSFACACSAIVFALWSLQRLQMYQAEQFFLKGATILSLGKYEDAANAFPFDRTLLVRSAETALFAAEQERIDRGVFLAIAGEKLSDLATLTQEQDGMIWLLLSWRVALIADVPLLKELAKEAQERMPYTVDTYRILTHSFQLVGDTLAAGKTKQSLRDILPDFWQDKEGRARILWKENPWLQEYVE